MLNEDQINDLLDQWEDHAAKNPTASPATFVANVCVGESTEIANELLDKIEKLQRIMPLVARLGDPEHSDGVIDAAHEIEIAVGSEPFPGYVLNCKIAAGGYGEVWEATGPGDFTLAMKFVRLAGRGTVEQEALKIAKRARHPNLVVTHGAWILSGYLIIAMELADNTLFDEFEAIHSAGGQGIPREALLRHMADAAAGIDYLNDPPEGLTGIQHRDIKPQNLLVVGGRTKVADFGIARIVQGQVTGHTGAMTIAYAAPEFFEGKTTNRSDQYSLAVTYCYLLTGKLPFRGTDAEVMHGHLHKPPDLSGLPRTDRAVVRRAMAKKPEERWPSSNAFVSALMYANASDAMVLRHVWTKKHALIASGCGLAVAIAYGSFYFAHTSPGQAIDAQAFNDNQDQSLLPVNSMTPTIISSEFTEFTSGIRNSVADTIRGMDDLREPNQRIRESNGSDLMRNHSTSVTESLRSILAFRLSKVGAVSGTSNSNVDVVVMEIDESRYANFVIDLSKLLEQNAVTKGRATVGISSTFSHYDTILRHDLFDSSLNDAIAASLQSEDQCVIVLAKQVGESAWGEQDRSATPRHGGYQIMDCDWFAVTNQEAEPLQLAFRRLRSLSISVSDPTDSQDFLRLPIRPFAWDSSRGRAKTQFLPGGPAGAVFSSGMGGGDLNLIGARGFYEKTLSRYPDSPVPLDGERVMVVLPGFFENGRFVSQVTLDTVQVHDPQKASVVVDF